MVKELLFGALFMILVFSFVIWNLISSLVPAFANYAWNLPIQLITFLLLLSPVLIGGVAVAFIWRREED